MTTNHPWRSRIVGTGEEQPDQLLANPKNWRTHPANQREALRGALDQVGWVQQVMVNRTTGHIVDGHARVEEALSRGEKTVPVLYVELEPHEEDVVLATLDPIGALATRDDERLRMLLAEVEFDAQALRDMTDGLLDPESRTGLTDADAVPPLREQSNIQRGEVWELGDHLLMCGDATDQAAAQRLLNGEVIHAVVTDPPYGIDMEGITNDSPEQVGPLYEALFAALPASDAVMAAFHSPRMFPVWLDAARAAGWKHERMLWLHRTAAKTLPWRSWVMASDPILLMSKGAPEWPEPANWCHDTYEKTHLEDAPTGAHPTIKPVEVVADLVSKLPRGAVLDPFSGSGTTLIAAEQLGRRCYGMEIDPRYVSVAIERWENFTGRKAQKVSDG